MLLFLFGYSYAKRFTRLVAFLAGGGVDVGARGRLGGHSRRNRLAAGAAWRRPCMLWVAGFDMIYACQDCEFDVKMRLRSVPARFGVAAALRLAAVVPPRHGRAAGRAAAGLPRFRRGLPCRRGGHRRAVGLRTLAGAPRRFDPRQSGVFPSQCGRQHRTAGDRRDRFTADKGHALPRHRRGTVLHAGTPRKVQAGQRLSAADGQFLFSAGRSICTRSASWPTWSAAATTATRSTTTSTPT